jgi:hypothetical protein
VEALAAARLAGVVDASGLELRISVTDYALAFRHRYPFASVASA